MPVETGFADYQTNRPTVFPAPNWLYASGCQVLKLREFVARVSDSGPAIVLKPGFHRRKVGWGAASCGLVVLVAKPLSTGTRPVGPIELRFFPPELRDL